MSGRLREAEVLHTRLLKCALEVDDARAYWQRAQPGVATPAAEAFAAYWFGAKSLDRVGVLLANMRARFDAFPAALPVLRAWPEMEPTTRALLCHWHLQLSDPLYRAFSGEWLVERRGRARGELSRDLVLAWVSDQGPGRWTMSTRVQFASKLLSAAYAAGLVGSSRDPRPLCLPRVGDEALGYLLYLLRDIDVEGGIFDNAYLRSVGLVGAKLDERLRALPGIELHRQGALLEPTWRYADLGAWAAATVLSRTEPSPTERSPTVPSPSQPAAAVGGAA